MRIRRTTAAILLAALLAGGCSSAPSGGSGPAADEAEEPTTTTTAPEQPWTELPDPGPATVPLAQPTSSGAERLETVCIEATSDSLDLSETETSLTAALDLLGAAIVEDGCAATFSITGSTTRSSATYVELGTCWTGSSTTASSTLTVDGASEGTWTGEQVIPVAETTSTCPSEDDPVNIVFRDELIIAPLQELYGSTGPMAANYRAGAWSETVSQETSEGFAALLLARLTHDPDRPLASDQGVGPVWEYLEAWISGAEERGEDPATYHLLIPQLIALLDCDDPCRDDAARVAARQAAAQATLQVFQEIDGTGTDALTTPSQWWEWWEDVGGAPGGPED